LLVFAVAANIIATFDEFIPKGCHGFLFDEGLMKQHLAERKKAIKAITMDITSARESSAIADGWGSGAF
jgi:argonaute-like protein implicated in RNA metabolism and viral defense